MDDYKIKQLRLMLEFENNQDDDKKYGANLSHWNDSVKPIQLDEGALKVLINYYSEK